MCGAIPPSTDQGEALSEHALLALDYTNKRARRNHQLSDKDRVANRTKSKVRAKVERPLLVLKRVFGFDKVRYRGLDKNAERVFVACGLVNLYLARRRLLAVT